MKNRSSKQAKSREFSEKARKEIARRDGEKCIFCRLDYHMEKATFLDLNCMSIMHYIPRSRNGLGIPQNGAIGCQHHHNMLDNGKLGVRAEMLEMFREYLKNIYPEWNEEELVYDKWKSLRAASGNN